MQYFAKHAVELGKKFVFRHTSLGAPRYPLGIEPALLQRLLLHIEDHLDDTQCIIEAGVARGATTRFLAEHLRCLEKPNKIYAIDTFAGFIPKDVDFEKAQRRKDTKKMQLFQYNDFERWKKNFEKHSSVVPIKHDISSFDFSKIAPIGVMLLDVDLYIPTKSALENAVSHICSGGKIFIDDIKSNNLWDGAFQAFTEFVDEYPYRHEMFGQKSGVIYV